MIKAVPPPGGAAFLVSGDGIVGTPPCV